MLIEDRLTQLADSLRDRAQAAAAAGDPSVGNALADAAEEVTWLLAELEHDTASLALA